MSETNSRPAADRNGTGRKNRIYKVAGRVAAGVLTAALAVPGLAGLGLHDRGHAADVNTGSESELLMTGRFERFDRNKFQRGSADIDRGKLIEPVIVPARTIGPAVGTEIDLGELFAEVTPETETANDGQETADAETEKPLVIDKTSTGSAAGAPGAILYMNYQNYVIITDTENNWFSSLPTQKGLYQIKAEYRSGEGISFTFARNNKHPDPMIFLPVYDICYNINLSQYPYIAVCYKSTTTDQDGHMYFATVQNAGLDESKNISIPMPHSDDWTLSVANAGRNGNWTGRLTTLRFDIAGSDFNGDFTVKWVGFFKTRDEANAFGEGGVSTAGTITPDKTEYARGEDIGFTVSSFLKGDWVALVQEGDACYTGSKHSPDLYVSDVMPLYWETLDSEHCVFKMDETRGIFTRKLLPAGRYDLVFYSHNNYVELSRVTITVNDTVAREPAATEKVYVTRAPETEPPAVTAEPEEPTDEPDIATATPSAAPQKTQAPRKAGSADKAGGTIALVCAILCAAALAVFFIMRKKKQQGQ